MCMCVKYSVCVYPTYRTHPHIVHYVFCHQIYYVCIEEVSNGLFNYVYNWIWPLGSFTLVRGWWERGGGRRGGVERGRGGWREGGSGWRDRMVVICETS